MAKYAVGDAYVREVVGSELEGKKLLYCIISLKRASAVLTMEAELGSVLLEDVVWIVGEGEGESYRQGGNRRVYEGGGLCASRNLAIELAKKENYDYVVQLSDDVASRGVYVLSFEKNKKMSELDAFALADKELWKGMKPCVRESLASEGPEPTCNEFARSMQKSVSIPAAATLIASVLQKHPSAKLGGVAPTANIGMYATTVPVSTDLFIVGDFMVIDTSTTVRFDETLTLKEDYDFTAQNMLTYGKVVRLNKVFALFTHYSNEGGAVDVRGAKKRTKSTQEEANPVEQKNIRILHHKFPGAFKRHKSRGINEIEFKWSQRSTLIGGTKNIPRPSIDAENPPSTKQSKKSLQPKITSFFSPTRLNNNNNNKSSSS